MTGQKAAPPRYRFNVADLPDNGGAVLCLYDRDTLFREIPFPAEPGLFGPLTNEARTAATQAGETYTDQLNTSLTTMKRILAK